MNQNKNEKISARLPTEMSARRFSKCPASGNAASVGRTSVGTAVMLRIGMVGAGVWVGWRYIVVGAVVALGVFTLTDMLNELS